MRLARPLAVAVLVAAALSVPQPAQAAVFKHPGVLVSRAQLDFVRANLGNEPWKSAWSALQRSSHGSLSYTAKPRPVVECGPSSDPDYGCKDEQADSMAAYTHALQWYLTKDSRYATKAIQIMDAWSAVISKHTGANAPLQTGWAGANFSRAAELIKHTYGDWPQAARFAGKLRTVYLPTVIAGAPNKNGNWELIMTDAAIGIAVHLDDRASFDRAVATWRGRLPAYIYLKTDGSLPKPPPRSSYDTKAEIIDYWHGQTTFVDGLTQETCRDFWHTGWGLAAISHVAETASHQGVDLYSTAKHRLRFAMDLHARLQLGGTVPSWLCGGKPTRDLGRHFEVGYNALHHRLGYDDIPYATQWVEQSRPVPVSHFLGWETLTHARNPQYAGLGTSATPDFDSDGVGDLLSTATGELIIWNGAGDNTFGPAVKVGGGWAAFSRPIAGDFNGDGISDLVAVKKDTNKLHIWNGEGANEFGPATELGPGWKPYAASLMSLGDVNGDGRTDLGAVHSGTHVFTVWNGKGGNAFSSATPIGGGWAAFSRPIAGDFNGDGISDLVAVKKDTNKLHIWNGESGNEFGPATELGPGWKPYAATLMSLGDVNRDGLPDIGAVHAETGTLTIWNGKGRNQFAAATAVGSGWKPYF
ncbi:FG-GAP-like repeat-containing protein [Nonomuraea phyllanthi]|uniref:FG-GAP-like repeat-containing protein n=1 Tax=Nonomuraea phyllanthi TaxID=2219224 RepID=UPI001D02A09F|nr:FG-GAP-like repeat-containing protein [Nonomuraea phyllanthi]